MDTKAAALRWAETWQPCWEALDAEPIVALYAEDAVYSSQPFREHYHGRQGARDYVSGAFGDEAKVRAWFGTPIVDGDGEHAAIEWWAALLEAGEEVTLAGTSVLRFDAHGLVVEQRDTWNMTPARLDPPQGWGR
ncbi:MAG: nuclear transport factor 2 family protein [Candidatus Limnocylindria bacterium]